MRCWKFLDQRMSSPFSGFRWPLPEPGHIGEWVEVVGPIEPCRVGIHGCRLEDLAWWMSGQLWELELDDPVIAGDRKVVASRGRLIRRVEGWPEVGGELAAWALWRTRDRAVSVARTLGAPEVADRLAAVVAGDGGEGLNELGRVVGEVIAGLSGGARLAVELAVPRPGALANPIGVTHVSARAAGHAATCQAGDATTYHRAFAAERVAQSAWLAARLNLG